MTAASPQAVRRTRRRDERGGAVSLWVVLMCPLSAFAAVVAIAGPQRLTAESSLQDAADDTAMFAVGWRDGTQSDRALPIFPPDCAVGTAQQRVERSDLATDIGALPASIQDTDQQFVDIDVRLNNLFTELFRIFPRMTSSSFPAPTDKNGLISKLDHLNKRLQEWTGACDLLAEALARDLGYNGIDAGSLSGFYSASLTTAYLGTSANTAPGPPCRVSERAGPGVVMEVRDAAHVVLVADWRAATWASSQIWSDGLPMAAESIGRISEFAVPDPNLETCGDRRLSIHDSQGRPVWPKNDEWGGSSRELVQAVQRFPLAG